MRKYKFILLIVILIFLAVSFTGRLSFRFSRVIFSILLGLSTSLTAVDLYNQYRDRLAKLSAVIAVLCFVSAVIFFFRLA